MKSYTEEEIRSNIVIPFLKDIGLTYNDLNLETTFSIQLGRGVYDVKNDKKHFIGGRLDILCKVDHKNLFIIELKAEDVQIDLEKDSKQGLSYARLMQPMPPYVIITNGKETYLFDTIYGKQVDKNYILQNGYYVSIEDDILFRFNALKNFIGYSFANLTVFCQTISNECIYKFCAIDSDDIESKLKKKYIPSIYIERNGLLDNFDFFLNQNKKNIFAIVGESGCGKTNSIIDLYFRYTNVPILFYSGTLLGHNIFEELKFDFNLEFTPQETELSILKKISSLTEIHGKQFLIFIDAIDEWIAQDKVKQLDSLIRVTNKLNIKICITCKDLLWPSLLNQNGVSTFLADKLFQTFKLENFNEIEFSKALNRYSNILQVHVSSNKYSSDLFNPFSLRIAFEVSHIKQTILIPNQDSANTISIFIEQKLIKSGNIDKHRRYLLSIADSLLKHDKIQLEESDIRDHLQLSINEEIPIELFLNSFLYKYNIDNKNYIGFYFSKIRDYIISYEILSLNRKEQKQRTEIIMNTLGSFIGENAINFYLKNSQIKGKTDCINSFIIYDQQYEKNITTTLLAQQEVALFSDLTEETIEKIILHINNILKRTNPQFNIFEEINTILSKINNCHNIENHLIEIIYTINSNKNIFYNTSEISRLFKKYNSQIVTDNLIKIAIDSNFNTSIRRFVIENLYYRKFDNRKYLFLKILKEEIETNSGVYFYISSWYSYVEDIDLRNNILKIFDSKPRETIVRTFFYSQLPDTGELLFQRFLNNKYTESDTWWLCRVICSLNYKPAIPKFIEIIKENPNSELSGHLLIGLGEMKAIEFKFDLLQMIKNLPENYNNETWLTHAFSGIMDFNDYPELLKIANSSKNIPTILFAAKTLSNYKSKDYNSFILNCICNENIALNKRSNIIHEWSNSLAESDESVHNFRIIKQIESSADTLNRHELDKLYVIFEQNNMLSFGAFSILLNHENNFNSLNNGIVNFLPILQFPIITHKMILINIGNLRKLKHSLNLWLKKILSQSHWDNNIFLFNCLQLIGIFGDHTYIELIENNKINIIKYLPLVVDDHEIYKERYLERIIHAIRISTEEFRMHLDV